MSRIKHQVITYVDHWSKLNFDNGKSVRFRPFDNVMLVEFECQTHKMGSDKFADFIYFVSNIKPGSFVVPRRTVDEFFNTSLGVPHGQEHG